MFYRGKTYVKIPIAAQNGFRERRRFLERVLKNAHRTNEGVMIESSYGLFGKWGFAIFFKADTNDNALHFVGEKMRALEGIAETSTSPMTMLKEDK